MMKEKFDFGFLVFSLLLAIVASSYLMYDVATDPRIFESDKASFWVLIFSNIAIILMGLFCLWHHVIGGMFGYKGKFKKDTKKVGSLDEDLMKSPTEEELLENLKATLENNLKFTKNYEQVSKIIKAIDPLPNKDNEES